KGALHTVSTFADAGNGLAIVEIDRGGDQQGQITVEGTNLVWSFDKAPTAAVLSPIGNPAKARKPGDSVVVERDPAVDAPRIQTSIHDDGEVTTAGGGEAAGFAQT